VLAEQSDLFEDSGGRALLMMNSALFRKLTGGLGLSLLLSAATFAAAPVLHAQRASSKLGIFDGQSDVGAVTPAGKLAYDPATRVYTSSSAGANLWSTTDAFHFVWKKVKGDLSLTADIDFPNKSGNPNPHRKALLMFRQTLDADGIYADAAQHGAGLTALQYRRTRGETTQDIELNIDAPKRLRIEKVGDTFTMFLSSNGDALHQSGSSIKLHLEEPFYVGIGVCSHDKNVQETATFANVELKPLTAPKEPAQMAFYSTLQIASIDPENRRTEVVRTIRGRMEAPNWSRDGKSLIFDQDGSIWRVPVAGGEAVMLDTGNAIKCNGSHGLSPDGSELAITCVTPGKPEARIYIIPAHGGPPRLLTQNPNSYFHSWSPDGKTILFARPSNGAINIVAVSIETGEEKELTTGTGISDDPDYSADGQFVYFNSNRSGSIQIWRMKPDGSGAEQVTSDDRNNWTPHPSPDGKSISILSYAHDVTTHASNKDIELRILSTKDPSIRTIVDLIGGSGTINVPSWSPDSQHFAFVSYQMLPADENGSTQ
jgi:TolB protein